MSVTLGLQANDGNPSYFDVAIPKDMSHASPLAQYLSQATVGGKSATIPSSFKAISVQLAKPSDLPHGTITLSWHGGDKVLDKDHTSAQLPGLSLSDITVWIPK